MMKSCIRMLVFYVSKMLYMFSVWELQTPTLHLNPPHKGHCPLAPTGGGPPWPPCTLQTSPPTSWIIYSPEWPDYVSNIVNLTIHLFHFCDWFTEICSIQYCQVCSANLLEGVIKQGWYALGELVYSVQKFAWGHKPVLV